MICTVVDVEFTRGSPFGEQWWKLVDEAGTKHSFAMCLNFNVPERWPRTGDTIEVREIPPRRCYTGGSSYIECGPFAELVKIVKRKDAA